MNTKILVAYASTHGSTKEVAEDIATTLRSCGLAVDLQPARDVRSLEGYQGVVLGAPLYMFRLHKDVPGILNRHRKALEGGLPVAIFAGGPFGESGEKAWQDVRKNLDSELAKLAWFKPASVEVIGGRFDPGKLKFPYNLIPALKQMKYSDLRDWNAIRAWATGLAGIFQVA